MTNPTYTNIEFENNLFKKLNNAIVSSEQRISYIADGGINRGPAYQRAINKFNEELEEGLDENTEFTRHEILYIVNELAINKSFFNNLMEYDELGTFIPIVKRYNKLSIYKKLFYIYFNHYSSLNKDDGMSILKMYLKSILRNYNGRNKYLNNILSVKDYIFGELPELLEYYDNDYDAIKVDIKLQDDFEFSKALLNLKIIQELKSLKYDENNQDIFSTIIERKEMFFADGLTLKEYVARHLIDEAINKQLPFPNWQLFILTLIGDPRSTTMYTAAMSSWNIIGEERKEFFTRTLSKDDLKLFLDALSDSVSDTNYHYRKAFWMQFLEKVMFAKILLGQDALFTLNDEMKNKFKSNNDSYGRLNGIQLQSAIYIDFGVLKIIEFTHSGQLRGYSDCPINLHKKNYTKQELDDLQYGSLHLFSIRHASPKTYTWQETALQYLNEYLKTNVSKNDIEIDTDKNKRERYIKSKVNVKTQDHIKAAPTTNHAHKISNYANDKIIQSEKTERNIYSKLSYDELKKIIHTGTNNSKVLREIGIEKEKKYFNNISLEELQIIRKERNFQFVKEKYLNELIKTKGVLTKLDGVYDSNGFNIMRIHKDTGKEHDSRGFNKEGIHKVTKKYTDKKGNIREDYIDY